MYMDYYTLLGDAQAVTATAATTNYYNYGAATDVAPGTRLKLLFTVEEAFDNLTSLALALQTDDNTGFSSATTLASRTVLLAGLTVGTKVEFMLPEGCEQYIRGYYTVTGSTPTAGKVTAQIVPVNQDDQNTPTPDGV